MLTSCKTHNADKKLFLAFASPFKFKFSSSVCRYQIVVYEKHLSGSPVPAQAPIPVSKVLMGSVVYPLVYPITAAQPPNAFVIYYRAFGLGCTDNDDDSIDVQWPTFK